MKDSVPEDRGKINRCRALEVDGTGSETSRKASFGISEFCCYSVSLVVRGSLAVYKQVHILYTLLESNNIIFKPTKRVKRGVV